MDLHPSYRQGAAPKRGGRTSPLRGKPGAYRLHSDMGRLRDLTSRERQRAALKVASDARDVDDCRLLLDALGLLDDLPVLRGAS